MQTVSNTQDKKPRQLSATSYPYFNLEQSIKVASTILLNGGGTCTPDQLAHFLGYSAVRNGTYMTRVSSARLFGLISSQGNSIVITDRARAIVSPIMPEDAGKAKIEAFLGIELYRKVYEEFRGRMLPPETGLKNLFESNFQIVKDRVGPAVRVFYESAEQAGLFSQSGDRTKLIIPPLSFANISNHIQNELPPTQEEVAPVVQEKVKAIGIVGDVPTGIDPALAGLLRKLPPPGPWNIIEKKRFFEAFKATFDFVYPEEGEI